MKGREAAWIRVLLLASAAAACVAGRAEAQGRETADGPATIAQAATSYAFDIPAKPLPQALNDIGRTAGLTILYTQDEPLGLTSPPLSGRFTTEQALQRLLSGSGFTFRFTGPNAVTLRRAPLFGQSPPGTTTLDPVRVSGERATASGPVRGYVATRTVTGSKTDTPILEIPQAINVITADQMRDQGAQSISQALRYTPGVLGETYGANSQFDVYTRVRGFAPDFYLDGTRLPSGNAATGWNSTVIEPYGLERVEILKGPASGLYGQSAPGGLINMASKRPTATPQREVDMQTGSFGRLQGAVDLSGPIDKDGKFLYRLTGLARRSDTQVDFIENNRVFFAPALTWRPTEDTNVTLLASYQSEWGGKTGFNYLPTSGTLRSNPNGRIPFERYSGDPDFDRFSREQVGVGYALEHRFGDAVTFRQNVRYTDLDVRLRALNRVGELQADNRTLNRAAFGIAADAQSLAVDNQAQVTFDTGMLKHTAVIGFDFRYEHSSYNVGRGLAPPIDIYNPIYGLPIADPGNSNFVRTRTSQTQIGVYIQDQIKFDRWILTLGGRHDWADATTKNRRTNSAARQDDGAFSGRIGLGYVFDNGIAPYVSYSTSFQPASGSDFSGAPFKPTKGVQYEGGIKYQPPGSKTLVTLSVFHLTQQNVLTPDPDPAHVGFSLQAGEVRARGFEIEGRTELLKGLSLIASYSYLDHEVTKSTSAAEVGRRLPNTPVHQASLWADYVFQEGPLAGFGIGGGVRYVGRTYDTTNATRIPGFTLVDATLHYDLGRLAAPLEGTRLTLTATNLFDKYYVSQCVTGAGCTLGTRRTIIGALNYRW